METKLPIVENRDCIRPLSLNSCYHNKKIKKTELYHHEQHVRYIHP